MKMNYELAKQLKDAGFPQFGNGFALIPDNIPVGDGTPEEIEEDGTMTVIDWQNYIYNTSLHSEEMMYQPTLSELIEACGDEFGELQRDKDAVGDVIFIAIHRSIKDMAEYGKTPEEAVAKLWLKLNEIS